MIPNTKDRLLVTQGVTASSEFGISIADSAHVMTILRDTLYSDKIMAVLREYSANAWDAHRMVKKHDVPIHVTIPTPLTPALVIRDFGPGLSQHDVLQVYTQYGASTKRDSDDAVGMLGIGSKSGFAYSDSFTITSHHAGTKSTYVAALDTTNKGRISLLHEEPTDETGIAIQIAVQAKDIPAFEDKARDLFKYFRPWPQINIELEPLPAGQETNKHGVIYGNDDGGGQRQWVAVMGCVPYRVNLDQLTNDQNQSTVPEYLYKSSGALYFNIGDVQVNASREELKYNDSTKAALTKKFEDLIETFVRNMLKEIDASNLSQWAKRIKMQVFKKMYLPVPSNGKDWAVERISLKRELAITETYRLSTSMSPLGIAESLHISDIGGFVIVNDKHPLRGFPLSGYPHGDKLLVNKVGDTTSWPEVLVALDALFTELKVVGAPVVKLSDMNWTPKFRSGAGRVVNTKHRKRLFQFRHLEDQTYFGKPYSNHWEPVDREPADDDVYVILREFNVGHYDFYQKYRLYNTLVTAFGGTVPVIYGYKHTNQRPVEDDKCLGQPFLTVFDTYTEKLYKDPDVIAKYQAWAWYHEFRHYAVRDMCRLCDKFEDGHLVREFFENIIRSMQSQKDMTTVVKSGFECLHGVLGGRIKLEAVAAWLEFKDRYPLFTLDSFQLHHLWQSQDRSSLWLHYIRAEDALIKLEGQDDNAAPLLNHA